MKINGVSSQEMIINYSTIRNKVTSSKVANIESKDTIEISQLAKEMKKFHLEASNLKNESKINELKDKISSGTYIIDSKVTAKSIIDNIKGINI